MWKDFSLPYIQKNKATSISIMVAMFIAALFISALVSLFYNMWTDGTARLIAEEGAWHARLVAPVSQAEALRIQSYANVAEAIRTEKGLDIYLGNPRTAYEDMPQVAELLGFDTNRIEYHESLLARRFVFAPGESVPLLWAVYGIILLLMCFSLVLIIRSAFQFSMNARMHQMGILSSIGATPKQIRRVLVQEALALSGLPILLGTAGGVGVCLAFLQFANSLTARLQTKTSITPAVFTYHWLVFIITLLLSVGTVLLSAWLPARRLSKISPLEAIKGEMEPQPKRMRKYTILSALFGVEGELARKSMYTRRKAFRTASLCLTLSFLVVSMMLVVITFSDISTGNTYWDRYRDAWDIMIEIESAGAIDSTLPSELRAIHGINTLTAYQKATGYAVIGEGAMSDEVKALGGYGALNSGAQTRDDGAFVVETPIIVLDNDSFDQYATQVGAPGTVDHSSAIVVNRIWDSVHSPYQHKEYVHFLQEEEGRALSLFADTSAAAEAGEMTVVGYAGQPPNLREEYPNFSLVQIVSQNAYSSLMETLPPSDNTWYITIRALSEDAIPSIEAQCANVLGDQYSYTMENRPEKAKANGDMIDGYRTILTAICVLLACIGIANVFANTLGYAFQRKREFARYQSVGLTPKGISKMLCVEMLILGVKPILLSIPFNTLFILIALNQSTVTMEQFIGKMPLVQMLVFAMFMLGSIGLAYGIAARQLKESSIVDALKDDVFC